MKIPTASLVSLALVAAGLATPLPSHAASSVRQPPVPADFDYQLRGSYPVGNTVKIVGRDKAAATQSGAYNICYINGFQTQKEENGWWETNHPNLLIPIGKDAEGNTTYLEDGEWSGERILNVANADGVDRRKELVGLLNGWVDACADKKFDAIELDNMDSFTRQGKGYFEQNDVLEVIRPVAARAHGLGLAVAQKNTEEFKYEGRDNGMDFALVERCGETNECAAYQQVYPGKVIDVEYTKQGMDAACGLRDENTMSIVWRDKLLKTPEDGSEHWLRWCWNKDEPATGPTPAMPGANSRALR